MTDVERTTESFVARVIIVLLNAILHYALYKVTVASIVLVKECIVWIFQRILKFNCHQRPVLHGSIPAFRLVDVFRPAN